MTLPTPSDPPRLTRAEAARLNGARSRGPRTAAGKRRSAMNALKHGLTAQAFTLAEGEDAAAYRELEARLVARYRPADEVAAHLVQRLASVMWRQYRGDRIEAEVLAQRDFASVNLHAPKVWDAARFSAVQRYQTRLDRMLFRLLDELERHEPAPEATAAPGDAPETPNEPDATASEPAPPPASPPVADPPRLRPRHPVMPPPSLPVRRELERLLASGDGNAIERFIEAGHLAGLGLGPEDVAEARAFRATSLRLDPAGPSRYPGAPWTGERGEAGG